MPSERFGLVGESGSGKSTTALALMGLIKPPGRIDGGEVHLAGRDLLSLSLDQMRRARLAELALIPQGAMNSLNPVATVRNQIVDGLKDHDDKSPKDVLDQRVAFLLGKVGLEPSVANMFPHELSGGMKQRVTIAISISLNPKLIIADEPTSALDVVTQMQVMETLIELQEEIGAALVMIGHDMGLMAQVVDRIGVMYAGKLVEVGSVRDILESPFHPYTKLLVGSLPSLESKKTRVTRPQGIPGITPSLYDLPTGCAFHPRCPKVMKQCSEIIPANEELEAGRWTACHLYEGAIEKMERQDGIPAKA
jgi:peptide/nickel transport system ATP-binding protein